MSRRRMPFVATLIISISLLGFTPAQSATIAGSKCTKLNSTKTVANVKYTCVKTGKKLIWNKGVAIKPTSVASPTPTPTPKPEIINPQLQYLDSVQLKLTPLYDGVSTDDLIPIEEIMDPESATLLMAKISTESLVSARRFASIFMPNTINEILVAISGKTEFIEESLGDTCGGEFSNVGASCAPGFVYANLTAFKDHFRIANDDALKKGTYNELSLWGNLPHEFFHQVQLNVAVENFGLGSFDSYPSWLREGGAEVAKLMNYAIANKISYHQAHEIYRKATAGSCSGVQLDDRSESYSNACEYTLGLYAAEYLVYKLQDFNSLTLLGSVKADSVSEAFEEAYKIKLKDFLAEASTYIKQDNP